MEREALDQTNEEVRKIVQLMNEILNEIDHKVKSTNNTKRKGETTF